MGAIIAVTGKSGSGKSVVLSNLACLFAAGDACVAVLSCDLRYQSLPLFFGGMEIPPNKSLGTLFGNPDLKDKLTEYDHMPNLFVAAPAAKESCVAYEPPDAEGITAFLAVLASTFDYVLIEAGEVLLNQFSMLSCKNADVLVNVAESSLQGIAWEQSCYEFLVALRGESESIVNVMNNPYESEIRDAEQMLGHPVHAALPYSGAVRNAVRKGIPVLLDANAGIGARGFKKNIKALYALVAERLATI